MDKFHDFLYGAKFIVKTDNNPLTYVLRSVKLNTMDYRWLTALSTYDNVDVDLLSQNVAEDEGRLSPQGVKVMCQSVKVRESPQISRQTENFGAFPLGNT